MERTDGSGAQNPLAFVFEFLLFRLGWSAEEPESAEADWNVEDIENGRLCRHQGMVGIGLLEISVQDTDFWDWLQNVSYNYSEKVEEYTKTDD